jgi:hypothetical protein
MHKLRGLVPGPQKVAALIAGLPTSFDDPRQQVVYEPVPRMEPIRSAAM